MFRVDYCKIVGFEEAIEIFKRYPGFHLSEETSDSYKTHIGDDMTLETATFEFFLGEKDKEYIKSDKGCYLSFLSAIRIYAVFLDDENPNCSYFFTGELSYMTLLLYSDDFSEFVKRYIPGFAEYYGDKLDEFNKEFRSWLENLPHSDLFLE